jgi:acetyl-CoA acetyltransferase
VTVPGKGRGAAIVGSGFSDAERHSAAPLGGHVVQACLRAIDDSGLSLDDIDGLCNYPNPSRPVGAVTEGVDVAGVNYVATTLAFKNLRWAASLASGTVGAALVSAITAVIAGAARHVLVWRGMYNPIGKFGRVEVTTAEGDNQFLFPYGLLHNAMLFAMPYSRYLWKYGKNRADMAPFVSNNRSRVVADPNSVFCGQPLSVEDYMEARVVAAPLTLYDCDMPITGCGAFVVSEADLVKDLRHPGAFVAGFASLGLPDRNSLISQYEHLAESGRRLAAELWRSAGMGPADVDQANLYDGFSYYVPFWAEWFGFCKEGEGLDFLRSDDTATVPINTNGGALGRGRLHGTPQVIEAVRQIQGRALNQVPNAEVTMAQVGSPRYGAAAVVFTADPARGR